MQNKTLILQVVQVVLVVLCLFLITSSLASEQQDTEKQSPYVTALNGENFADKVLKKPTDGPSNFWFIKFYAPWCGHCQHLAPTWIELGTGLDGTAVHVGKVDCTKESDLCNRYSVRGYPSLFFFKDGEMVAEYEQSRSLSALQSYAGKMLKIPKSEGDVIKLTTSNFESEMGSNPNDLWFVKFSSPDCENCKVMEQSWTDLAKELTGTNIMVADVNCVAEPDVCKKFSVTTYPTLIFIDNGKMAQFKGGRTVSELSKFARGSWNQQPLSNRPFLNRESDSVVDYIVQMVQESPAIFFGLVILVLLIVILCVVLIICLTDQYETEPIKRTQRQPLQKSLDETGGSSVASTTFTSSTGDFRERPVKAKDY